MGLGIENPNFRRNDKKFNLNFNLVIETKIFILILKNLLFKIRFK